MNRRLKKLIEEKAWETLTDYGYNDSQLLEQLTEAVLKRLNEQVVNAPIVGNPMTSGIRTKSDAPVMPQDEPKTSAVPLSSITKGSQPPPPPGAPAGGNWWWTGQGYYYLDPNGKYWYPDANGNGGPHDNPPFR
jgi:hypothetical protein